MYKHMKLDTQSTKIHKYINVFLQTNIYHRQTSGREQTSAENRHHIDIHPQRTDITQINKKTLHRQTNNRQGHRQTNRNYTDRHHTDR